MNIKKNNKNQPFGRGGSSTGFVSDIIINYGCIIKKSRVDHFLIVGNNIFILKKNQMIII